MKQTLPPLPYTRNYLFLFVLTFIFIHFIPLASGQNLQMAPVNPDFVKYQQGEYKALPQSIGGHGLGLVPEPILPHFSESTLKASAATLPVKYDLRTAGTGGTSLLTSVKNQGSCGACWTFSMMGNIEGFAKKPDWGIMTSRKTI